MSEYTVEMKALAENIESMSNFSEESLRSLKLPEPQLQEFLVAIDEAITNIVIHSYPEKKGDIKIIISRDSDSARVELIDSGRHFDPTKQPLPDFNVPIEERQIGGMGLPLIKKLSDGVSYERKGQFNHFILTKKTGGENV